MSKKTIIRGIIKHEYRPYKKIKIKPDTYKVKTKRTRTRRRPSTSQRKRLQKNQYC